MKPNAAHNPLAGAPLIQLPTCKRQSGQPTWSAHNLSKKSGSSTAG